jgi:hypothetical protein
VRAPYSPTAEFHMSTQVSGYICRGEFYWRRRVGSDDLGDRTLLAVCDQGVDAWFACASAKLDGGRGLAQDT